MKAAKRGMVIVGGKAPNFACFSIIREQFPLVIAADSGLDLAEKFNVRVDKVVGDMDSLKDLSALERYNKSDVYRFSKEKDLTDTEIGLQLLTQLGCSQRAIFGGGGGRLDHLMAILALFDRPDPPWLWVSHNALVVTVENTMRLQGQKGRSLSFFPVGADICKMTSRGLKWPLDDLEWRKGDFGISNVVENDRMEISAKSGKCVMVSEIDLLSEVLQ